MVLWTLVLFSLALSACSLWLAVRSARISAAKSPAKWNTQLAALAQELIEVQDLVHQMQQTLKKRGARNANAARWSGRDGEPDPTSDPEAWKKWINSGGIRQYLRN